MFSRNTCRHLLALSSARQSSNYARKKVYKNVTVASDSSGFAVKLDDSQLKTPLGNSVVVPSEMAANAVAREWSIQDDVIKPEIMPLTQLINLAIDQPTKRPTEQIASDILEYLETDTLRCRSDSPDELVERQTQTWDPILKWLEDRFKVEVPSTADLFNTELPAGTVSALSEHIVGMNHWSRTSLESATNSSKSFATAIALLEGRVDVDQAISVSQLENMFQIERWGNVEWAHQFDLAALKSSLAAAYLVHSWCGAAS